MKKKVRTTALASALLLSIAASCARPQEEDKESLLLMLAAGVPSSRPLGSMSAVHAARAGQALQSWRIGLSAPSRATSRSFGTWTHMAYEPMNYMTVTDDACSDPGVPADLAGPNCPFAIQGGVPSEIIGVCQVREYRGSAEIADTTLLVRASYQDDPGISAALKQAIWTHEVGHCLGMQHASQAGNLMYPYLSLATTEPSPGELQAANAAYFPVAQAPDTAIGAEYYLQESGASVRQFQIPSFHTPPVTGSNPASTRALAEAHQELLSRPLNGEVTIINQMIRRDGREQTVVRIEGGPFEQSPLL